MKKYILPLFFISCAIAVAQATEIDSARQDIGSSMNSAVSYIKGIFTDANEDVTDSLNNSKDNKVRADHLYKKSQEEETNPTVLEHAKKNIQSCDYDSENLHWTGSKWDCVKAKAGQDCQVAPDEYRYQDSNGDWVCAKHPAGGSINYYYSFRGYGSKCTGAHSGYEKLYDCVYKNKLGNIIQVSDSYCSGKSKPSQPNKLCSQSWTVGSWGSCSSTCGGGTQYRDVYCQSGYDCSMYPKPDSSQSCNSQLCSGSWTTGAWSTCSATACGTTGTQTRSVSCPANLDCSAEPKPASSQSCSAPDCGACTWTTSAWSSCSATACGTTGTQTRTVTMTGPAGCTTPTTPKPPASQSCSAASCNYTYSWNTTSWGTCSQTCGGGTQSRSVYCKRSDGTKVADSYCKTSKPASSQSCNTHKCPVPDKCGHLTCSGSNYIFQCLPGDKDKCTYVSGYNGCSCTYKDTGTWVKDGTGSLTCLQQSTGQSAPKQEISSSDIGRSCKNIGQRVAYEIIGTNYCSYNTTNGPRNLIIYYATCKK
jgi:hypothetical protein